MTAPDLPIPAQVLDLRAWKWTAPYPDPKGDKTKPAERKPADLAGWQGDDYLKTIRDAAGAVGVRFVAPVIGPTTPGSFNVRSELREMDAKDPTKGAAWSSTSGAHALVQDMAFLRYPTGDPECGVVGGQIHDAKDDVAVWRFESTGLWLALGDHRSDWRLVDPRYRGGRIATAFTVADGQIECWYQGRSVHRFAAKLTGCYFKAGAYTQANAGPVPAGASNYGAAVYYGLQAVHGTLPVITPTTPAPTPAPVPTPPPAGTGPDTILIIRHAEKAPDTGNPTGVTRDGKEDRAHSLTPDGWGRAGALVALFTSSKRFPKVTALIASQGGTQSRRPAQTLYHLAKARALPIDTRFDIEAQPDDAAAAVKAMTGCVLISAEHGIIPAFTRKLDAAPPADTWPDDRYDVVWRLDRAAAGYQVTQVPQQVMPGDRSGTI